MQLAKSRMAAESSHVEPSSSVEDAAADVRGSAGHPRFDVEAAGPQKSDPRGEFARRKHGSIRNRPFWRKPYFITVAALALIAVVCYVPICFTYQLHNRRLHESKQVGEKLEYADFSKVYFTFGDASNMISLILNSSGLIFVLMFWPSSAIQSSSPWYMLVMCFTLLATDAAYFTDNQYIAVGCFIRWFFFHTFISVFFAILTVNIYVSWKTFKKCESNDTTPINRRACHIYVVSWGAVGFCLEFFLWIVPYLADNKPLTCNNATNDPHALSNLIYAYAKYIIFTVSAINFILAFFMAVAARHLPSICDDSYTTAGVCFFGLAFVGFGVARLIFRENLLIYFWLKSMEDASMLAISITTILLIILKRVFYLGYSNEELVRRFLKIDWKTFCTIRGIEYTAPLGCEEALLDETQ